MNIYDNQGLTLIELLVTVVVLAVLAAIAVPSLQGVLRSNQLSANTNRLVASLHQARSEAIKRNEFVSVCAAPSAGDEETIEEDGNQDWSQGWYLTTASFCDGSDRLDATETARLSGSGIEVTNEATQITFRGDGTANAGSNFKLSLQSAPLRVIEVKASGSVSSCRSANEEALCN